MKPNEKIREVRTLKGFSQEYIANKMGVSQKAYSKIERGQTKLGIIALTKISDILELSLFEVLYPRVYSDKNARRDESPFTPVDLLEELLLQHEEKIESLEVEIKSLKELNKLEV